MKFWNQIMIGVVLGLVLADILGMMNLQFIAEIVLIVVGVGLTTYRTLAPNKNSLAGWVYLIMTTTAAFGFGLLITIGDPRYLWSGLVFMAIILVWINLFVKKV